MRLVLQHIPLTLILAGLFLAGLGCGGKSKYKYRIAVVPKGETHEFWQSIHRGAQRAADDSGKQGIRVEILWQGPQTENDALQQINIVRQKAGMGIQGLVLAPQHRKQMVPVVKETVEKGIPVVIIDSGLDKEVLKKNPDLIVKYVATDNHHGGELAAEHLLKILKDKKSPRLILFRYQAGSQSTEQREQGFLDYIERENNKRDRAGQPPIEILDKKTYAGPTAEEAEREATPLLLRLKDKNPDGIFAVNESATFGMLRALRSQGLNQKIHLVGFDSSEPLLQALRKGDVDALVVQDPYRMGYLGVWTLVQHLEGKNVRGESLNLGTGETVVTRENLDQENIQGLFDPAQQEKRTIKVDKE